MPFLSQWRLFAFRLMILAGTTIVPAVTGACGTFQAQPAFHENQLIHVPSRQPVAYHALSQELLRADVVYLGEEHYTPSHIRAAIHVLTTLVEAGKRPALALEMFGWDGQSALDRWIRGALHEEARFLQEAHWQDNWGGEFRAYKPLIAFARKHRIPVYGLNPPRALVRLVAKQGLEAALQAPAMAQWGIDEIPRDDPEYRRIIFRQIRSCHPNLSREAYERIYEASIFRDEGMAKVIRTYLRRRTEDEGPLVSYTGSGHMQYGVPVPKRVKRDLEGPIVDLSIYLMAFDPTREDAIQEAIRDGIADYLWLTAPGPRMSQRRCG